MAAMPFSSTMNERWNVVDAVAKLLQHSAEAEAGEIDEADPNEADLNKAIKPCEADKAAPATKAANG